MLASVKYLIERLEASERRFAAAPHHFSGLANPGSLKARLTKAVRLALEALLVQPLAVVRAIASPNAAHPVPLGDDAPGTDLLAAHSCASSRKRRRPSPTRARPPSAASLGPSSS